MPKYSRFVDANEEEKEVKSRPTRAKSDVCTLEVDHTNVYPSMKTPDGSEKMQTQTSFHTEYDAEACVVTDVTDPAAVKYSNNVQVLQWQVRRVVEHLIFRLFSLSLIIIDICVLIADLCISNKNEEPYDIASLCFVSYFVVEVSLRIFGKGLRLFFMVWYNALDFMVVMVAFVVTIVYTINDYDHDYAKLVVAGRLIRVVLFIRLFTERKNLETGARLMVSQNKRRYQRDGFDLDLTYVTERVIAMSFPSSGKMSLYRNPITEVSRFLHTKHPKHFKVYNLCSEKSYDTSYFDGRVERYMIDDHTVPLLRDMLRFVESVRDWFAMDESNVIAVHCKGGKGRTGTMICLWLVEAGLFDSAEASLDYFGNRRTDLKVGSKFQGVETPSQSRYVGYYQSIKEKFGGQLPPDVRLKIKTIKIHSIHGIGAGDGSDLRSEIFEDKRKVFELNFGSHLNCLVNHDAEADCVEITVTNSPILVGNIKINFYSSLKSVPCGYENCPFYFIFHTSFIEDNKLLIPREQLDNPHKPKTWKVFRERFAVELTFESAD